MRGNVVLCGAPGSLFHVAGVVRSVALRRTRLALNEARARVAPFASAAGVACFELKDQIEQNLLFQNKARAKVTPFASGGGGRLALS